MIVIIKFVFAKKKKNICIGPCYNERRSGYLVEILVQSSYKLI